MGIRELPEVTLVLTAIRSIFAVGTAAVVLMVVVRMSALTALMAMLASACTLLLCRKSPRHAREHSLAEVRIDPDAYDQQGVERGKAYIGELFEHGDYRLCDEHKSTVSGIISQISIV